MPTTLCLGPILVPPNDDNANNDGNDGDNDDGDNDNDANDDASNDGKVDGDNDDVEERKRSKTGTLAPDHLEYYFSMNRRNLRPFGGEIIF